MPHSYSQLPRTKKNSLVITDDQETEDMPLYSCSTPVLLRLREDLSTSD